MCLSTSGKLTNPKRGHWYLHPGDRLTHRGNHQPDVTCLLILPAGEATSLDREDDGEGNDNQEDDEETDGEDGDDGGEEASHRLCCNTTVDARCPPCSCGSADWREPILMRQTNEHFR